MTFPLHQSEQFTSQVIAESIARMQRSFDREYGPYPIKEGEVSIGSVIPLADKVAITFRESRDNIAEVLTCVKATWEPLRHINLQGRVHKGVFESFDNIHEELYKTVSQCLKNKKIDNPSFMIEGHSHGSSLATLVAAYMKKIFPASSVSVLTYSPMAILDKEAAQNYTALIGEECHLSFIAKGDPLPPLFEKAGFYQAGRKIEFSPESSLSYQENVANNRYPYLRNETIPSLFVRLVLGSKAWNAHMLETYRDVVPTLMPS